MSFLLSMQRYGGFLPIPRNSPNSSLTCSDNRPHRRHIRQMPSKSVVSSQKIETAECIEKKHHIIDDFMAKIFAFCKKNAIFATIKLKTN